MDCPKCIVLLGISLIAWKLFIGTIDGEANYAHHGVHTQEPLHTQAPVHTIHTRNSAPIGSGHAVYQFDPQSCRVFSVSRCSFIDILTVDINGDTEYDHMFMVGDVRGLARHSTHSSEVSFMWIPASTGASLTAMVDGQSVDEVTFDRINSDQVIIKLLSDSGDLTVSKCRQISQADVDALMKKDASNTASTSTIEAQVEVTHAKKPEPILSMSDAESRNALMNVPRQTKFDASECNIFILPYLVRTDRLLVRVVDTGKTTTFRVGDVITMMEPTTWTDDVMLRWEYDSPNAVLRVVHPGTTTLSQAFPGIQGQVVITFVGDAGMLTTTCIKAFLMVHRSRGGTQVWRDDHSRSVCGDTKVQCGTGCFNICVYCAQPGWCVCYPKGYRRVDGVRVYESICVLPPGEDGTTIVPPHSIQPDDVLNSKQLAYAGDRV